MRRCQLGITGTELTTDIAKSFGYNKKDGAFVNQVMPDSAAAKAGIKAGDIIISIDGKPIRSFGELRAKIATMGADKQVALGLIRDGKEQTVKVTLKKGSLPLGLGALAPAAVWGDFETDWRTIEFRY